MKKIMALAMATSLSVSAQVADDISFYDIIVKGSLFRPLGWVEPNEKPKYNPFFKDIYLNFLRSNSDLYF